MTCPSETTLVDRELGRLATQYREATKFQGMIRAYLGEVASVYGVVCRIPEAFDLITAVGEQLTFIGRRLGWPRCHCVCVVPSVFGFACESPGAYPIAGFCETGTWLECDETGSSELCLSDDEEYRRFLLVRRYQALGLYDIASLTTAVQTMWGSNASVIDAGNARVVLAPGRTLTAREEQTLPLALRVMPVAPGIGMRVQRGAEPIFGFGTGWQGFCQAPEARWLCPETVSVYDCN